MSAERPSGGASSDRNRERRSSTTGSIHGAGEPTYLLGDIAIKVAYVIKTHMVYHGGNTNPPHMLLPFKQRRRTMVPWYTRAHCGHPSLHFTK